MSDRIQFSGFTPDTGAFLWDLAFHNERPWFLEHKQRFLTSVKEPFDALGRALLDRMQERYPDMPWQLHVSRIYRDARRLFGRGPYKDHLWLTVWSGADRHDNPAFWTEISPTGYEYGVGFFQALPREMEEYRRYIREHPEEVSRLARRLVRRGEFALVGEDYKRPRGDVGELLNPWYNKRWVGVAAAFDYDDRAYSPSLPEQIAEAYEFLMPYYRFFRIFRQEETENYSDL